MRAIRGTIKHGQIFVAEPIVWPEGTEVRVKPVGVGASSNDDRDDGASIGDAQEDDPQSLARWLAEFDAIPPLDMSPDEESQWQAARSLQRQLDQEKSSRLAAAFESLRE